MNQASCAARSLCTPDTAILSGELIFRIILVGLLLLMGAFGLFEWALYQGASEAEARTIAVNVFAVGQSFYLLICCSLTRRRRRETGSSEV